MRNPKVVLNSLTFKAQNESYVFERLYRNLYNTEFYLKAYAKVYPSKTNLITNDIIDGMSLQNMERLIEKLKKQTYQPKPARKTSTPAESGKTRRKEISRVEDVLVQEVIRQLLGSIYEPQFLSHSHAFRPNRSCHTALKEIRNTFTDTRWFIEGDIGGFFDLDHHVLVGLLQKRIRDEKLINLIWKFLGKGYLEEWAFHKTFSGTPKGGIISPLLMNIYLHELDKYVQQYNALITPYNCQMRYVRYANRFIIGVNGSKKEAEQMKTDVTGYLADRLKLERRAEKTTITHSQKNVRFLGHDIRIARDLHNMKTLHGTKKRKFNYKTKLFVPHEKYIQKLIDLRALKMDSTYGWKPVHRSYLMHNEDLEILRTYNAEIEEIYNYYRLASNVHVLQSFRQTMKNSMIKTYSNKYQVTVRKVNAKFKVNGRFGIRYKTKNGIKIAYFTDQK